MNAIVPITPQFNVSDMERIARAFAASKLFGVQNADQALALCLVAQAEGRHPATAAQDYSIIQGRPSKKADAMLRDFIANSGKVEWHTLDDTMADATFSHPQGGSVRISWDMKRAQQAQLGGNAMYKKYPRQMLRSRTVSEGVRTVCPGATSGMYVPEEVQDIVQAQHAPQEALPAHSEPMEATFEVRPSRKSSAQAKRDGDHETFIAKIHSFDNVDELDAWISDWGVLTETMPKAWLDPMNDKYLEHRNELVAQQEAEFPGDRVRRVAGSEDHMERTAVAQ